MDGIDKDILLPRIKVATEHMAKKLSDYKKDQLPGGKYWTPTAEEKEILQKLAPNNDVCESILGLNDWITMHTPNLCQVTKSTLVEVKKNKTMTWLDSLTEDKRSTIVNIAQRKRRSVKITNKEEENILRTQRIRKIESEKKKAQEKEERRQLELEKLTSIPIIYSEEDLCLEINKIEHDKSNTIPGKEKKKLELLKKTNKNKK